MKRKVNRTFVDKHTKIRYNSGSFFVSEDQKRIDELEAKGFLDSLELDDQPPELKHLGGGYYLLPGGLKVRGKEKALKSIETEVKSHD